LALRIKALYPKCIPDKEPNPFVYKDPIEVPERLKRKAPCLPCLSDIELPSCSFHYKNIDERLSSIKIFPTPDQAVVRAKFHRMRTLAVVAIAQPVGDDYVASGSNVITRE
jgi:hypothetical protein